MKKLFLLLAVAAVPFVSNAQELGLETNYKSKKQQRLSKFKPHQPGEMIFNTGFTSVSRGYGLMYNVGAEYMINEKLGIRGSFSSNNFSVYRQFWGYQRYTVDLTYHFIQKKRWDVYAFAGVGAERMRFNLYGRDGSFRSIRPVLNAGVGARYKVSPSFGVQAELGRISNIGVFKKFNLMKK